MIFLCGVLIWLVLTPVTAQPHTIPPSAPRLEPTILRTAPLEIAKVFGRAAGCQYASPELIFATSEAALRTGLDPKIAAATVAVESGCNPYAVSNRGAIGLMQVRAISWKDKYDFAQKINLLNTRDNLQVGTEILSGLIRQWGQTEGIRRYQGTGSGGDEFYVSKILSLAGRK